MPRTKNKDVNTEVPYRIGRYLFGEELNRPIVKQLIYYYDHCKFERGFTDASMINKISSLNHFVRWSKIERLEDLDNSVIKEYIMQQSRAGLKPRTTNNRLKHVLAMARFYRDEEDMELPLFKDKKIHKQHEEPAGKRAFTRDTIYEALRYADREEWLMIKIMFDCGLRIMELRNMRVSDIDGNRLLVHGKGRKNRFAILSDEVVVRLNDWIKQRNITDYIWLSDYSAMYAGRPKTTDTIRKLIRRPFTAAGINNVCPHELRHSYATDLKRLGASTRSIQQGMGHTSEKITEIYLKDLDASTLEELYKLKYQAAAPEIR